MAARDFHGLGKAYLQRVEGADEWYWYNTDDYSDPCDAEDHYELDEAYEGRRWGLVHYPDGDSIELFPQTENVFTGAPVYSEGAFWMPQVAYEAGEVRVLRWSPGMTSPECVAAVPREEAGDIRNLQIILSPITLACTLEAQVGVRLLWPEKRVYDLDPNESLQFRDGDLLYMWRWVEDPDYREMVQIRRVADGTIVERFEGSAQRMPNGEIWRLRE